MKKKDEIQCELNTLAVSLGDSDRSNNVFHIPENYFQQFPASMMDIIQHMNADAHLATSIEKTGPFTIPEDYFDRLVNEILLKTKAMDVIVHHDQYSWQDEGKINPYQMPQGYFADFEQRLMDKISEQEDSPSEEIESIAPLLATLKKEQVFSVPEGYFNSDVIIPKTKVEALEPKVLRHTAAKSIKWARWAAAAAVMAIFTLGGLHYLIPSSKINNKLSFEQSLAKIPSANIKEWLSNNMDESDINNLGGSLANVNDITASHSLKKFSDKEIKDYLETEVW